MLRRIVKSRRQAKFSLHQQKFSPPQVEILSPKAKFSQPRLGADVPLFISPTGEILSAQQKFSRNPVAKFSPRSGNSLSSRLGELIYYTQNRAQLCCAETIIVREDFPISRLYEYLNRDSGKTKSASRTKSCPEGRTKSARCADEIRSYGADGGVSSGASGSTNYEVRITK